MTGWDQSNTFRFPHTAQLLAEQGMKELLADAQEREVFVAAARHSQKL